MIKLRNYQEDSVKSIISQIEKNKKALIVMPTGSGKTVVFSHIINYLKKPTLIIAHTGELIKQSIQTLENLFPNLHVTNKIQSADVCVLTIQKSIRNIDKLKGLFEVLIVDECHRAASASYRKLIDVLGFENKILIGATATPYRTDCQSIYKIFGLPERTISILDLVKQGYLCNLTSFCVKTAVSLKGISTKEGDFISSRLSSVINVKKRNELILKSYKQLCEHKKAVAFCSSLSHATELCKIFKSSGIPCENIHGKLPIKKREKILSDFKNGKIQVLMSVNILTEGFDEPSIEALLMCRPTTSKGLYTQMIGRGLRLFPGKQWCLVVDFTDNDYDVCYFGDLLDAETGSKRPRNGETILQFEERVRKDLLDSEGEIVFEKKEILKKDYFFEKKATDWQKNFLKQMKVRFNDNLTELMATKLIEEVCNG